MRKVVTIFKNKEDAFNAMETLTSHDLADNSLTHLSNYYERQICQEIFLRPQDIKNMVLGAFGGMISLGTLFYFLSKQSDMGDIIGQTDGRRVTGGNICRSGNRICLRSPFIRCIFFISTIGQGF